MRKIIPWLKRNAPTIFSWSAVAGVVATGVLSSVAAWKSRPVVEDETRPKRVRAAKVVGYYLLPLGTGALTIFCILKSDGLSRARHAGLVAAYMALNNAHRDYAEKVRTCYGADADTQVRAAQMTERLPKDISKPEGAKLLWYEEHYGQFFERTLEEVMRAEYHFNRNFVLRGYANLNELLSFLDLPEVFGGDAIGWSMEAGEVAYGYSWVDFDHREYETDDGLTVHAIEMPFPPTADYLETEYD